MSLPARDSCSTLFLHQRWHVFVSVRTDGGVVAGAIIGAILFVVLIVGLLYYVIKVRGYKLSSLSLPTRSTSNADVVGYWLVIVGCEQRFRGGWMLKLCFSSVAGHLQQPQLWNRHVNHHSCFVQYIEFDTFFKNKSVIMWLLSLPGS